MSARLSKPAEGFLAHRGLIALTAGGAMAEAGLLSVLAPAARPLAPQVTALPALAIFHDLRWLFGYDRSWLELAAAFVLLVLAQSAVSTALIRLSWPRDQSPPGGLATFGRSAVFTVTASVLLSPVVTLLFGVALLPFSWPFLAALPAMLLIMIPLAHGGLLGSWWRRLPPARAVGWLLASFIVLSAAAAVMARLPAAAAVPVAGLAGLANARAWYGVAVVVTRREAVRPMPWEHALRRAWARAWRGTWPLPVSPIAAAAALALLVGMTRLVFVLAAHTPHAIGTNATAAGAAVGAGQTVPADVARAPNSTRSAGGGSPAAQSSRLRSAVLVIPGFGSSCCWRSPSLRLIGPASLVRPFSYRGLDSAGRPLPYGFGYTNMPLPLLGDRIAAQAWQLHRATGRPVSIVAESEGTLGVYAMLARHPGVPLSSLVLLSPIVDPGRPDPDAAKATRGGPVSSDALSAVVRVAGALSPWGESAAQRLVGSVSRVGGAYAAAAARHAGKLRWLTVVPLADAVTLPTCDLPRSVIVVPALHGTLLSNPGVDRTVHRFLTGEQVTGPQRMRDTAQLIAGVTAAWRMPQTRTASSACRR